MNDWFQFKQFTIRQKQTPMKVGTDGVLLGAWANTKKANTILDIGTGTGLIALMAAQTNPSAHIDAVELETEAYHQACENIANSPWKSRIHVFHSSIQNFFPNHKYDCILCNPPFFIQSTKTPHQGRTIARHNDTLNHTDLIEAVQRLLTEKGHFYLILPPNEAKLFIDAAEEKKLFPIRVTFVHPTPEKPAKRYLITFCKFSQPLQKDKIIIELSRHQYSEEFTNLAQPFYLYL